MVPSEMTGVEWPLPGIEIRHFTFSVAEKFNGASLSATPLLLGPRHCLQESLASVPAETAIPAPRQKQAAHGHALLMADLRIAASAECIVFPFKTFLVPACGTG